jgi:hypothetical protein
VVLFSEDTTVSIDVPLDLWDVVSVSVDDDISVDDSAGSSSDGKFDEGDMVSCGDFSDDDSDGLADNVLDGSPEEVSVDERVADELSSEFQEELPDDEHSSGSPAEEPKLNTTSAGIEMVSGST